MMGKEKKAFKKIFVRGKAMYASLHAPKKAYNPEEAPQYVMDLVLDDKEAKKLLDEGLKVAKTIVDEDTKKPKEYIEYPGQKVFSLRRKTEKRDKTSISPPEIVDSQNNPIPKDVLIGNGSEVIACVNPYNVNFQGKEIVGHSLLGVQVLKLVPYTNTAGSGFEKTEGFTVFADKPQERIFTSDEDDNLFN